MNNQVVSEYNEFLKLTGGDKAAAASLTLAAALRECQPTWATEPADRALTVAEVADRLNISPQTVYDLVTGCCLHPRECRESPFRCLFALPLDDRNDFSCIPEHLITFDEAKRVAGELTKGGNTGRMRYDTRSCWPKEVVHHD